MNQIFKRLTMALLSILISGLNLIVNLVGLCISSLGQKEWKIIKMPTFKDKVVENYKIEKIDYVVEHSEYDSPSEYDDNTQVEWGEYNPNIKDIKDNI